MLRTAEQLGALIRLRRKERRLSQRALAELLGVERKWVLRLESGNPGAELGLVLKALDTLGIRAYLADDEPPRAAVRRQSSRIEQVFRRLRTAK